METERGGGAVNRAWGLLRRSLPVWLSLAVLAAAVVLAAVEPPLMVTFRNAAFDSYQRWHPRQPGPEARVRVVDIDDRSLEQLGQWPWPRSLLGELVARLRELGADAVALDATFPEPDRSTPARALAPWRDDPAVRGLIARLPDFDRQFAERIAAGGVVTGFALNQDGALARPPLAKAAVVRAGADPLPFLPAFTGAVVSLPELEAAAAGNGAINAVPGRDGVVRRVQLLFALGERIYPSLTAEALRVGRGGESYVVRTARARGGGETSGGAGILGVRIGELAVDTDANGGVWLHYAAAVPEQIIPAWRVLAGEVAAEELAGAIALVGTSAAGLKDLRFNALGELSAGVTIHAQAIEQILDGTYLSRPAWAKAAEILFMVALGLGLVALIFRFGALWAATVGAATVAAAMLFSWLAFTQGRLLLDPAVPALASLAVYLVCSVTRQVRTEREKRWIRKAFSSYISPNLVRYLIDNPDELDLGGERRECSFVLTDLAGFTTLVETSAPEVVVELLNEYLEGMVTVAFRHEGTIDRIVGDAVAVMFSAPVVQPDHAARAVACALEMDAFSQAFRERKRGQGIELGHTRIGVNTGPVTIGNYGGESLFDYRALGDAVNTASRLEGANRHLGTRICVSGTTVAACEGFSGRPVGTLMLKGKAQGVEAFEPLPAAAAKAPAAAAFQAAFELLRRQDPGAEAAFAALAADHPDDPLAAFHLDRLRRGEAGVTIVLGRK